jgi:hypothetical protein
MSESDPNGKAPSEPGSKLDAGKPCVFQGVVEYFPRAVEAVAAVSTFGAQKYVWKGWETVPDGIARYSDAMMRHILKEGKGETTDPDSKMLHAAHTAWGALARLELMLRDEESMKEWADSPEGQELIEQINGSFYLQPGALSGRPE